MQREQLIGLQDSPQTQTSQAAPTYAATQFSLFSKGYRNQTGTPVMETQPMSTTNIEAIYHYITGDRAKNVTLNLRSLNNEIEFKKQKMLQCEVVTFAGLFSYRNLKGLASLTGFMTLDVDHLKDEKEARQVMQTLISDPYMTSVLSFVSPSGRGVKDVIVIPDRWRTILSDRNANNKQKADTYKAAFQQMYKHLIFEYGIVIDTSGSDITRACFLPWDPQCYINPAFITNTK